MRLPTNKAGVGSTAGFMTYEQLQSDPFDFRSRLTPGSSILIRTDQYQAVCAAVSSLDGIAGRVLFAPFEINESADVVVEIGPSDVRTAISELRFQQDRSNASGSLRQSAGPTRYGVYTSGTTGAPKRVDHTVHSLTRTVVEKPRKRYRWGAVYDPNRMAGLQVLMQAMAADHYLYAVDRTATTASQIEEMITASVNALSATPSLWRRMLQSPRAVELPLIQITLGGEIVDQAILDSLRHTYPKAHITHVFASTEAGAAFSVTDGSAGFPAHFLDDSPLRIELQIRDNLLWVRSPESSVADSDGFVCTGDLVERVNDRVYFRGRESGTVNVGGTNVVPEVVEDLLRTHPEVRDAVVKGQPNPMTGNILVADVVLHDGASEIEISKRLRSWVREHAPKSHVPAIVRSVEGLEIAASGKTKR